MTTLQTLEAARNLLSDPARWCRNREAEDNEDRVVRPDSSRAIRWCVVGALAKFSSPLDREFSDACDLLEEQAHAAGYLKLTAINDLGGHRMVLEALDAAIATAARK